jgi:hypothetical protein
MNETRRLHPDVVAVKGEERKPSKGWTGQEFVPRIGGGGGAELFFCKLTIRLLRRLERDLEY